MEHQHELFFSGLGTPTVSWLIEFVWCGLHACASVLFFSPLAFLVSGPGRVLSPDSDRDADA